MNTRSSGEVVGWLLRVDSAFSGAVFGYDSATPTTSSMNTYTPPTPHEAYIQLANGQAVPLHLVSFHLNVPVRDTLSKETVLISPAKKRLARRAAPY